MMMVNHIEIIINIQGICIFSYGSKIRTFFLNKRFTDDDDDENKNEMNGCLFDGFV